MSVHRTKKGKWEARWREGSRNRSRTFDLKSDAIRFESEARRQAQLGNLVPPRVGGETLDDLAARWFDQKEQRVEKSTAALYHLLLRTHVVPFIGHFPVSELRPAVLDQWQTERLNAGAGPVAIGKTGVVLRQVLAYGVKLEILNRNPADILERPESEKRETMAIDPEQLEDLRQWFIDHGRAGDATLISIMGLAGLRPGEALALEWRDIEGADLSITKAVANGELKKTKTRESRLVRAYSVVGKDISAWKLQTTALHHLLFPRAKDGLHWTKNDWDNWRARWFGRAAKEVGLDGLRPYDLRHSCASLLIAENRPVTSIAKHMGHSPETCLSVYAHEIEKAEGRHVDAEAWINQSRDQSMRRFG